MNNIDKHVLICKCNSCEHNIIIFYDKKDNEIYFNIHLSNYRNIFKRIIIAIKYVLGYKCKFGTFDEFILSEYDKILLFNILKDGNNK